MKQNTIIILSAMAVLGGGYACKKSFLDVNPVGVLDEATLSSAKGVDKLLIASYAMLDGHDGGLNLGGEWGSSGSNFLYGGIAGGDANKGSDPGDQGPNMTPIQRHEATSTNGALNDRWKALYEGIKRTNVVLQVLGKVKEIDDPTRKNLEGQARFLRGWFHFQARILWNKVPFIDEKKDADLASGAIAGVANDKEIFPEILADLKYAWDNLPERQNAVGKTNKWIAGAVYGKVLLFAKDYANARTVLSSVVASGTNSLGEKFGLLANYDDNFNVAFDNNRESVFVFQASSKDNAGARNANWGDLLNLPATGPSSAGFFCPTYWFTNSFKTDDNGLPVANPQNNVVLDPAGQAGLTQYSGNVDTRLDWTIGRNQVPYHDWGTYLTSWQRDVSAGPFGAKKTCIRQSQVGETHDANMWFPAGGVALNLNLMRFSEVILLLAEAEIEAGSLNTAFTLINQIRNRAANSRKVAIPAAVGVAKVAPYASVFASKDEATKALRLERQLELGMEGHRFFDLVRWGVAATELNAYFSYESALPYQVLLKPKPTFDAAKNNYFPIPQQQIDLSNGFIKQQ
jgi:hypothetical protein